MFLRAVMTAATEVASFSCNDSLFICAFSNREARLSDEPARRVSSLVTTCFTTIFLLETSCDSLQKTNEPVHQTHGRRHAAAKLFAQHHRLVHLSRRQVLPVLRQAGRPAWDRNKSGNSNFIWSKRRKLPGAASTRPFVAYGSSIKPHSAKTGPSSTFRLANGPRNCRPFSPMKKPAGCSNVYTTPNITPCC